MLAIHARKMWTPTPEPETRTASRWGEFRTCWGCAVRAVAVDTACSSSLVGGAPGLPEPAAAGKRPGAGRRGQRDTAPRDPNRHLGMGTAVADRSVRPLRCARPTGSCVVRAAGVVVLKRLTDAVRDGDRVLAVVRGSAVNQDGRSNGVTAPNAAAQRDRDRRRAALRRRRARTACDYVEAHGTGTMLGDPIEFEALAATYGRGDVPCALGSSKTNIGHLEAAAGIAGFIKAALAVQRGLHSAQFAFLPMEPGHRPGVDPILRSDRTHHVAVDRPPAPGRGIVIRLRAGRMHTSCSSRAHDPVATPARTAAPAVTTLVVSGKTRERVASVAATLADWMEGEGADVPLADVAHTLNHHRARHGHVRRRCARAIAGRRWPGYEPWRTGARPWGGGSARRAVRARAPCSSTPDRARSGPGWAANCWPTSRHSPLRSPIWNRPSSTRSGSRCAACWPPASRSSALCVFSRCLSGFSWR